MNAPPEQQLRAYVDYLRDLGVYDLYHRKDPTAVLSESLRAALSSKPAVVSASKAVAAATTAPPPSTTPTRPVAQSTPRPAQPPSAPAYFSLDPAAAPAEDLAASMPKPKSFDDRVPVPTLIVPAAERPAALDQVRTEIGDCTRCALAYGGRHKIVFADGDASARLMFVGEGPGADEDAQGLPFVGKAGQLLNNMIAAMGLQREEVYIANIVKCRPPSNRTPEFVEATTCSQFLIQQIDIVRPEVIVALGATAATYLLGVKQSLASLRGQWFSSRGAKVAVTYHPAFLLRDPRQKGEAWKDLQRVMFELGLKAPTRPSPSAQ